MPISVVMPALEMAQETGKLLSWLKKEGDSVAKGEPLLEIETDKAVMEIESPGESILTGFRPEENPLLRLRCPQCLRKYQLSQPQPPTLAFATSQRNFATRPRDGALSDRSVAVAKMLD